MNVFHCTIKTMAICFLTAALFLQGCTSKNLETPKGFQIHPEFTMQLVASEPLVFDPVDMRFDEHGQTFILEMPGYPASDAESRLVQLIDSNHDGIYDNRKVVDDSLGVATSFMPYKNGFLVAAPPHLLWLIDADADGTIDTRKKLMNGFSTGNLQHNFNGLTYGLDNWIYAANGGNSGKPFFENKPDSILNLRGRDLKMDLGNEVLKAVGKSSGGFKITFDDWGHLFETHNLNHVSHLVFEDRYLEKVPVSPTHALMNISDHEENGTSRIYPIGEQETRVNHPEQSGYFSGACGITYYGGGAFPDAFNDNLLVADCVLNLIHFDILANDASTFKSSRMQEKREFLASSDRSFRPVNMEIGPDGALYVLDIHREVIEHPEWIPDEIEAKMDLNAGKDKGRIYKILPKNNWSPVKFDLIPDDLESLVSALNSTNQWTRNTAQRLLVTTKKMDAIPLLNELVETSNNPLARLHGLWTLEGLHALETSLLKKALQDPEAGIRENAIKIVEIRLNEESYLAEALIPLFQDPNARVRMQAALSLSTLNDSNYYELQDTIAKAAADMLANSENDVWAIRALASVIVPQALSFSQLLLNEKSKDLSARDTELLSILSEKIGRHETGKQLLSFLETINKTQPQNTAKTILVEALARGVNKNTLENLGYIERQALIKALNRMESQNDLNLIGATGNLRNVTGLPISTKIKGLIREASKSVLNSKVSSDERLAQLKLIGQDDFTNREELLYRLLDNTQPLALQLEALSQLQEANNKKVGERLLQLWPTLGPRARKKATDILLYQSHNHDALLTAMEKNEVSLGEFNLDLERRRTLLFWSEKEIQERAKSLFSDAGVVKRADAIEKMRPALAMAGTIASGSEIFKSQCAQCHRYGDTGQDVGPVLTEVNRKSKEALLYDILDPNAAVDTEYLNHSLKTKDGTILTGLVFLETDEEVGIKMIGGSEKIVAKTDIEQFGSLGSSMMFEGLENTINHQEMADLLAFLQQ